MALLLQGCFFVVLGVALKVDVGNAAASSSCSTSAPSDATEACPTDQVAIDVAGAHDSASWIQLGQTVLSGTAWPQVPGVTSTAEPQVPVVNGAAEPQVPVVTGTAEPQVPVVTGTAEPQVPVVASTAEPQVPVVTGTAEPQVPVVNGTAGPQVPVVNGTAEPQVPVVNGTTEPQVPVVNSTAEPPVPVVNGTAEPQVPVVNGTAEHQDDNGDGGDDGDGGDNGNNVVASRNYFCINEGKSFASSAKAKEYFHTECVDRYGYELALCSGLADKVFEKFNPNQSASWLPDTDVCTEINSLLSADAARRLELGLPDVVASPPTVPSSAMLQRSTRSHSGSSLTTFDEVLRWKPALPPPP